MSELVKKLYAVINHLDDRAREGDLDVMTKRLDSLVRGAEREKQLSSAPQGEDAQMMLTA
jgi:hypothetical protein